MEQFLSKRRAHNALRYVLSLLGDARVLITSKAREIDNHCESLNFNVTFGKDRMNGTKEKMLVKAL